jgi:hypothetical protein
LAKFILVLIVSVNIIWGLLLSLLPSFYPTEAEKKGESKLFSTINQFHVTNFLLSVFTVVKMQNLVLLALTLHFYFVLPIDFQ